ncbi:MAG TPA: hypothetical protein VIY49_12830 [Bryobacteraceae bacterium]
MTNRFGWLVALLVIACLAALAADIDGKWTAEVQGGKGPQTQTLNLKAQGDKLTGTIEGGRGGPVEISEGMIHGNDVMFKVVREFNGNKVEQNYKGTFSGDDLKMTVEGGRGPQDMAFKRAK